MDVGGIGVVGFLGDAATGPGAVLLAGLWRAAIGGALFTAPVWLACRLLPRLPAAARFWLWWLVCVKLVAGLAFSAPLLSGIPRLVLRLPAQHQAVAPAFFVARLAVRPAQLLRGALLTAPHPSALTGASRTVSGATASSPESVPSADASSVPPDNSLPPRVQKDAASPAAQRPAPNSRAGASWQGLRLPAWPFTVHPGAVLSPLVALLWALGVAAQAVRLGRGAAGTRRLLRAATLLSPNAPAAAEAERLARRLGVRRTPRIVFTHAAAAAPFVCGVPWRPVIVLPASDPPLTAAEIRMTLTHEMAHIARKDLWRGLVPALAECLFFSLPPARRPARECAACREEVCDAAAVAITDGKEASYARLLLKVAAAAAGRQEGVAATALGMAASAASSAAFAQMRRRLRALQDARRRPSGPRLRRAAALLVAISLPGMLPWRLRALPRSSPPAQKNHGDAADAAAADDAAPPRYAAVDLGTLGGAFSAAYGIAGDGTVVGTANAYRFGGRGHAALWRPGNGIPPRDLAAGSVFRHSLAYAVNVHGETVASAYNHPLKPNAFLWSPAAPTRRRYLGTLPGFRYSAAFGISDAGLVAGAALRPPGQPGGPAPMRAFLWQRDGEMRDLGTLGGRYSAAMAVSESGVVAGKADTNEPDTTHPFLWTPEETAPMRDLGVLPGGRNSAALAVNRSGITVGYSEAADTSRHAFVYVPGDAAAAMEDLGALPPPVTASAETNSAPTSIAYGINDAGLIVGSSSTARGNGTTAERPEPPPGRAVAWLPPRLPGGSHRLIDLNDRLTESDGRWVLEAARGVNERGEIVGVGRVHGKRHAFLLIPLPPAAAALSKK